LKEKERALREQEKEEQQRMIDELKASSLKEKEAFLKQIRELQDFVGQ
jgi:hypothetical protein